MNENKSWVWERICETPKWVWGLKFLLTLLAVVLMDHFWKMSAGNDWGWPRSLHAMLTGMIGVLFWVALDVVRGILTRKVANKPPR